MADPNLPMLEDAVSKLTPFLDEIVFVGGITLGLLITDTAAAPIRGTTDVDVIAKILTYADYIEFSERLREVQFTEDSGERPLTCRWHNGELTLDPPPISHIRHVRSEDRAVRQPDGFAMENLIAFPDGEFCVVIVGACHGHLVPIVEGRGPHYVVLH